ncbi:MAG TPA: winged helix-turn-helix domain-containing protein [Nitrososphaeraceae archaeon]|nr:winged helix-turn-helix domain-containing protein [Nitrososphaeraceae archaeon]
MVALILKCASGGATKTKIMYNAYLSYNQLREYLTMLMENELVDYIDGKKYLKLQKKD